MDWWIDGWLGGWGKIGHGLDNNEQKNELPQGTVNGQI